MPSQPVMAHAEPLMTARVGSFVSMANATMTLMWEATYAKRRVEEDPGPLLEAAVPQALYGAKASVISNVDAHPTSQSTRAFLTVNDFRRGGDGGGPSKCDGRWHENSERIVGLSTGWFGGMCRCGKKIKITASNGRSTRAKVVDECDSVNGCDGEHGGQPPCENSIVDASKAVWDDLRMTPGKEPVTWSMA